MVWRCFVGVSGDVLEEETKYKDDGRANISKLVGTVMCGKSADLILLMLSGNLILWLNTKVSL